MTWKKKKWMQSLQFWDFDMRDNDGPSKKNSLYYNVITEFSLSNITEVQHKMTLALASGSRHIFACFIYTGSKLCIQLDGKWCFWNRQIVPTSSFISPGTSLRENESQIDPDVERWRNKLEINIRPTPIPAGLNFQSNWRYMTIVEWNQEKVVVWKVRQNLM